MKTKKVNHVRIAIETLAEMIGLAVAIAMLLILW